MKNINSETKERFIKLETRLKGIIDNLIEHTTVEELDLKSISFLKIITTENTILPFKFFSLFELSRLNISGNRIMEITNNLKGLILCIYLICKILIKGIMIEAISTSKIKNPNTKK
jgi:hypothetical protein